MRNLGEECAVMTQKGLVHIYHGDGKGKTTCGMGLCVRAAGAGKKVLIYQFLKNSHSSELAVLKNIPGVTVMEGKEDAKFTFCMTDEEKAECKKYYTEKFREICQKVVAGDYDVLYLDEILHVINKGMIEEDDVLAFLDTRPEKLEVIMNGYYPGEKLREAADYISFIQKEKHPFDKGIPARVGIEK